MANAPRISFRFFDGTTVSSGAYGGLSYDPSSTTPLGPYGRENSYDNLGPIPVGSAFSVFRAFCNNWEEVGTSATAENFKVTLHSGVHKQILTGGIENYRERDGFLPEGSIPQTGAYQGQILDQGALPPDPNPLTNPINDTTQNQAALGGDSFSYGVSPTSSGRAQISSRLWTSVRVSHTIVKSPFAVTPVATEVLTKIGYISTSPTTGVYNYYIPSNSAPTAARQIADRSAVGLEIQTSLDPQYAGTGNLYARFHAEYTWV